MPGSLGAGLVMLLFRAASCSVTVLLTGVCGDMRDITGVHVTMSGIFNGSIPAKYSNPINVNIRVHVQYNAVDPPTALQFRYIHEYTDTNTMHFYSYMYYITWQNRELMGTYPWMIQG